MRIRNAISFWNNVFKYIAISFFLIISSISASAFADKVICVDLTEHTGELDDIRQLVIAHLKEDYTESLKTFEKGLILVSPVVAFAQQTDSTSRIDKKEEERLQQYQRYAKRKGSILELTLASGNVLKFEDRPDVRYTFSDYLQPINYFLVLSDFNESSGYLLVNRKTGQQFNINNIPVFSPKLDRLVTVSICDSGCLNQLQIWRVVESGLQSEWTFRPEQYWASGSAKWLDDSTIEVTSEIANPATSNPSKGKYVWMKKSMLLRLLANGWHFSEITIH